MRRIDRYVFREILTPALIALAALTFVFFSSRNGVLLEIIIRQLASASELWTVSTALLPSVLSITIPMALLMGILTGFGRMSSDSEMIALRASGVSMRRILHPVMALGILAAAATMTLTVWIAPKSLADFTALRATLAAKFVSLELKPGVFNEGLEGKVVYATEVTTEDGLEWRKIMMADMKNPDNPTVTLARFGALVPDHVNREFQLTLTNTTTLEVSPQEQEREELSTMVQARSTIPMRDFSSSSAERTIAEVPTQELWQRMRSAAATQAERADFHQRLALPFACIAFALLGLPLGVSTSRGGKSMGLVLSLILMFSYYMALIAATRIAAERGISPLLAAWAPNVVFGVLGLILLARSDREYENRLLSSLGRAVEWGSNRIASWRSRRGTSGPFRLPALRHSKIFRLLDLYVLRGFTYFFVIVLAVFTSLFVVVTLFELLPDILENEPPTTAVVLYFIFLVPQILYWTIPLAVLLAILINLGTLTKTNEVLAVKAGAVSLYRMALPLIGVGAALSLVVYLMQDFVLPPANKVQDSYRDVIKGHQSQTYSDPGRKWMKGSADQFYYYTFFDREQNVFGNLYMIRVDPETWNFREWAFAPRAEWRNGVWVTEGGWVREMQPDRSLTYRRFDSQPRSDIDHPDYFKKDMRESDQMNYAELRQYVAQLRQSGFDVTRLTLDLYRKLSFPLVTFIMALIGIPFSFKTGRKGAFYGIGLCVAIGILYWFTFELFGKLGGINRLEPFIAAWFPNLIFGAGGLWLMLRVKT